MAQESKDKEREVDEDEAPDGEGSSETMHAAEDEALVKAGGGDEETSDAGDEGDEPAAHDGGHDGGHDGDGADEGEEGHGAAQLGSDRYVLAGFFASGMLGAYVLGRAIQTLWSWAGNRDWFSQRLPQLAAVSDDDKGMYGIILAGVIATIVVYRSYRRPDIRTWSDEVAAELAKVVWPDRKEVTSSTFIVIVSSAVATIYLALLDRLWAFITNIVYGDGS